MKSSLGHAIIADDVRSIHVPIRRWLEDVGFVCKSVFNGASAMQEIQRSKPDIVVSDINMPEASGFDLLAMLRNSVKTDEQELPVLLMSSLRDVEIEAYAEKHGATGFVTKPLDRSHFLSTVFRVARNSSSWGCFEFVEEDWPRISPTLRKLSARASLGDRPSSKTIDLRPRPTS